MLYFDGKGILVNGERLPNSEVRALAASLRLEREARGLPLTLDGRFELVDEARHLLIDRLLLVQEARHLSLTPTAAEIEEVLAQWAKRFDGISGCRAGADTAESRDDIRRRLMIDRILARWRGTVRRPRLAELQDYYRVHKREFHKPETVHASQIVRHFESASPRDDPRAEMECLRHRVLDGEDFGDIAVAYSDCPENRGDLGWFSPGVMVPEFDEIVFATRVSSVTPVFRTEFGFHIALIHARRPGGIPPFDEVRSNIEQSLWLSRQDQEIGRALACLQSNAVIANEL